MEAAEEERRRGDKGREGRCASEQRRRMREGRNTAMALFTFWPRVLLRQLLPCQLLLLLVSLPMLLRLLPLRLFPLLLLAFQWAT